MADLIIYGASDDLVEVEGAFREEYDAYSGWRGRVTSPDGDSLIVTAVFGEGEADWTLGILNSSSWPDWPIKFGERPDREGDPALIIDVPEGTIVEEIN